MNVVSIIICLICSYINLAKSWILHRSCILNSSTFPHQGSQGVRHPFIYTHSHVGPLFAKKKAGRVLITLECSVSRKLGLPPSRYYTTKNKVNTPHRLELMKYNKYLKKHTLHKEIR